MSDFSVFINLNLFFFSESADRFKYNALTNEKIYDGQVINVVVLEYNNVIISFLNFIVRLLNLNFIHYSFLNTLPSVPGILIYHPCHA